MAQSPNDMEHAASMSPEPSWRAAATLVMNPPAGGGRGAAPSLRPEQLSQTVAVLPSVEDTVTEGEEPSIEEYMAALLERTRQFSVGPAREAPSIARPAVEPPAPVRAPAPSPVPAAAPAPAPECRNAISELRELANISARSSFNTHQAQRLVLEMQGKRFVAVAAMACSVVLLTLASSVQSPAYMASVAAATTACAFSLKYLSLGRELKRLCVMGDLTDRAES